MMTPSKLLTTSLSLFFFFVADAFTVGRLSQRPSTTTLFLEDWVANLIDEELYRQSHKKDFENEWMEKNRAAVFSRMETDFMFEPDKTEFVMHKRDEKMAKEDPQKYCADRCVTTGNCDIYEDYFEMSPQEVIKFCTECVLSEEEEECDIPDGFYDKLMP
mmetsp:Transcript_52096/g.79107  ORF Transcript_52096/g.79107 Transcript_52096/m.79107 type:complete len:160 (-) Transcript_52096:230-709(-)|eukprot:CAMPEP_0117045136 /NCGR_PEP_ID=MMETSP0472-20121206/31233_1 /TAXON_ID=693140 ORGANISM="Tiarina fusus, Strain LIS" /NCGR_SAMPLE_ID=MMETSP0472 /ASSEMBLY_ACC=CAM_ASM_000603 /LENGTH=159 /DNA_ID=CAMNT_0004757037 /DNA_START=62 /DNA_END=541 /DNA_ORIENTATION=-